MFEWKEKNKEQKKEKGEEKNFRERKVKESLNFKASSMPKIVGIEETMVG